MPAERWPEAVRGQPGPVAPSRPTALVDPLADDRFTWGRFSRRLGYRQNLGRQVGRLVRLGAEELRGYVDRVRGFDRSADYDPPIFIDGTTTRPPIAEPDAAGAIESLYTAPIGDVRIVEVPEAGERIDGIPGGAPPDADEAIAAGPRQLVRAADGEERN